MQLSKKARSITPYTAGEQPQDIQYIKLNTNENPFAPSPKAEQVLKSFNIQSLRLYPDPDSAELKRAIAKAEGVSEDCIFVGNGSDEVLAFAFNALFSAKSSPVLFADITYSFYPVYCDLFDINYITAALSKNYELLLKDYTQTRQIGGIVIANPNAPTSIAVSSQFIQEVLAFHRDIPVIVDEAYVDFADKECSSLPLVPIYENLLVVKTFSKSYGLAGIRCGYAVGQPKLIEGLRRIKNSFNSYPLDRICQAVCAAAVSDRAYFDAKIKEVCAIRNETADKLREMGYEVALSSTNFLFLTVSDGFKAYNDLKEAGVLVRFFDKPNLKDKLRITVGTRAEMQKLIDLLNV